MANRRLDIMFDLDGPLLTYGPDRHDHLASIIHALKSSTGGYENAHMVDPRPASRIMRVQAPEGDKLRHYTIVFFLPPVAARLLELDKPEFLKLSGLTQWAARLKLDKLTVQFPQPTTEEA